MAGEVSAVVSLTDHLERYLEVRRSVGFRLEDHGHVLPGFVRAATERGETTVHTETALAWALDATSEGGVVRRLSMVRGFARYLVAFDATTEVPGRGLGPPDPGRTTPHIFSDEEIARLIEAADTLTPATWGATMATIVGLMTATGLRTSEVRQLDRSHVDLDLAQITVWHSKFGRSRRIPLHETTVEALAGYRTRHDQGFSNPDDTEAFFVSPGGRRLTSAVVSPAFRELCRVADVTAAVGRRKVVLGDLRHGFAVSTLLGWHRAGVDVGRQLPVLSAYLGHVNPRNTYWYLEATPELMALVAERLERSSGGQL